MKNSQEVIMGDLTYITDNLNEELIKLEGNSILITGGAGFLGYYLIKTFLHYNKKLDDKKKICIYLLDNFFRGKPAWLEQHKDDKNLVIIEYSIISNIIDIIGKFKNINYIIHAASIASPIFYRKYPIETMDANVNGLRNLLDFARFINIKNFENSGFLFFSTSEIYGDPDEDNIPTSEEYRGNVSCVGPRACYDESKRYGETMCVNFFQEYGIPISIARPFNNYGPGLKISDGRALPDIARNIFNNEDVVLLSDGSPTRTFCYIADAIIGYIKVLINGKRCEPYNIGTKEPEISINKLAKITIDIAKNKFGYNGKLIKSQSDDRNYLVDNPKRRCPSIKKAFKDLGFSPSISIEEGIERSLVWYKDNI